MCRALTVLIPLFLQGPWIVYKETVTRGHGTTSSVGLFLTVTVVFLLLTQGTEEVRGESETLKGNRCKGSPVSAQETSV